MEAQSKRIRHITENIANSDTPGYRRKVTTFQMQAGHVENTGVVKTGPTLLDQTPLDRHFDPFHPLADGEGYYTGSNVNLVVELADAREAQRSYEANLNIITATRQMLARTLDILRV